MGKWPVPNGGILFLGLQKGPRRSTFFQGLRLLSIATGTWYNARVSKSPCEYKNGAVTFYFAELERAHDQKEWPYVVRDKRSQ